MAKNKVSDDTHTYLSNREKRIARMNRVLDQRLRTEVERRSDGGHFKKHEIIHAVAAEFKPLEPKRLLDIDTIFDAYVDTRLVRILRKTDRHGLRLYENYADGSGERRWRTLRTMTADQLRVCIFSRERQIAGEEAVLNVYKQTLQALEEAEAAGAGLVVGDVIDWVAEDADLPKEETG